MTDDKPKRGPMAARKLLPPTETDINRFFKFVEKTQGCWWWTGSQSATTPGYGRFWYQGRLELPHRVSLAIAGIDIPEGLVADHICNQKQCVNPKHFQFVTQEWNCSNPTIKSPFARNKAAKRCINGHEYTPENTAIVTAMRNGKPGKGRMCLTCYPHYWRHAIVPRERPPGSRIKPGDPDYQPSAQP